MNRKILVIKSESRYLKPLRNKVKGFLIKAGWSKKIRGSILVAIGEACTNSIRHSYGGEAGRKIRVVIESGPKKVIFRIRDYGRKIDLSKVKIPKLPRKKPHGLGIYLVKTMMDEVKYNMTHPTGNELILTKYKEKEGRP